MAREQQNSNKIASIEQQKSNETPKKSDPFPQETNSGVTRANKEESSRERKPLKDETQTKLSYGARGRKIGRARGQIRY